MKATPIGIWRGLCLALLFAGLLSGCASFSELQPFREEHDGEQFFVSLHGRGKVFKKRTEDGKPLQAIRAFIFRPDESQAAWTDLSNPEQKILAHDTILPHNEVPPDPTPRLYLLPDDIKGKVFENIGPIADEATLDRLENQFLKELDDSNSTFQPFLIICTDDTIDDEPCFERSRTYTVILGARWTSASAFPLRVEKRSKVVSAATGLGWLLLLFMITVP